MDLTLTPEQHAVMDLASGLAKRAHGPAPVTWQEAGEFPWSFMRELAAHGLTGISIDAKHGGQGQQLIDAVLAIIAVGVTAPHLADAVHVTNFGAVQQIAQFGSPRLVREVLSAALAGEALITAAMSEPDGGTNLAGLRTRARIDGDQVVVDGSKVFNSNGPHATHYVVWSRFSDDPGSVGAVVVPAAAPGARRGATERFMSGEPHCMLHFDQCRVPADYVLLRQDGMRAMMPVFNIERLGNASRCYAYGTLALQLAADHMRARRAATGTLADKQGLQWKLADMRLALEAAKLLIYQAATQLTDGTPDPLNASMAKLSANEASFAAVDQALQIFGGYGFTSDSPLDYLFKRTRGWMIAGGSVESLRHRIAREVLRTS